MFGLPSGNKFPFTWGKKALLLKNNFLYIAQPTELSRFVSRAVVTNVIGGTQKSWAYLYLQVSHRALTYLLTYHLSVIHLRPNQIFRRCFFIFCDQITLLSLYSCCCDFRPVHFRSVHHRYHVNSLTSNQPEFSSKSNTINQILLEEGQFKCLNFILET